MKFVDYKNPEKAFPIAKFGAKIES